MFLHIKYMSYPQNTLMNLCPTGEKKNHFYSSSSVGGFASQNAAFIQSLSRRIMLLF